MFIPQSSREYRLEWEPNERDAWVADAQRWIGQIKGVRQCKIELDAQGEVAGIHVVAGCDREPRHIVRDVESLLKARLGLDVYYKKIGVVQVLDSGQPPAPAAPVVRAQAPAAPGGVTFFPPEDSEPPAWTPGITRSSAAGVAEGGEPGADQGGPQSPDPGYGEGKDDGPDDGPASAARLSPPIPAVLVAADLPLRLLCSGVGVLVSEKLIRAEVHLRAGRLQARGVEEGPNHPQGDLSLIGRAALTAVTQLLADELLLHLHDIRSVAFGGQSVILAAVNLVEERRSELLWGCCADSHNRQQAAVFAVLDALNRRLAQYPLKESQAEG